MVESPSTPQLVAALNQWAATPHPAGLGSACAAILWLASRNELDTGPAASVRPAWGAALQACRQPGAEHFVDPAGSEPVAACHTSQLALQALDALDLAPRDWPATVMDPDPAAWLAALDWAQPLAAGAVAGLRLQWLALFAERRADPAAMDRFRAALAWLDQSQAFETGLWGVAQGTALDDALLAAARLLVYFEYVRWPLRHARQRLDVALERLDQGYLPGPARGTEAAASLAWLLAVSHQQYNYRRDDVVAALVRLEAGPAAAAAAPEASSTGAGLVEAAEVPDFPLSRLEAAWWAALARAFIAPVRQPGAGGDWHFARRPGPGCLPQPALSPHEQQALPHWLGRLRPAPALVPAARSAEPAVTVVIPVYNLGRYLPEAVASVFAQTTQDLELIVVDDGSTDAYTRLLLAHWPYAGARLLRQPNRGVATARNDAIAAGTGRYVCCLDADDRLRPAYLEQAIAVLDRDPTAGFVSGHMQTFDGAETLVAPAACALPDMLAQNRAFQPALFRRTAWQAVGGYDPAFSVSGIEDWDLWISFLEHGYHCVVLPEVIFDYRILPNSMTSRMSEPDQWAALVTELVGRHPALYQQHLAAVLAQNAGRIAELKAWGNNREQARAWWERQAHGWQQNAERLEKLLAAQVAWTQELQRGKDWLEQQLRAQGPLPEQTHD